MTDSKSRRQFIRSAGRFSVAAPAVYALSLGSERVFSKEPENRPGCYQSTKKFALTRNFNCSVLELVRLLKEVTEVEHSLMLQYLYAGFSIKPQFSSIIGAGAPDSESFLGIAVQEMQHLGSINRLLVELGAAPNLSTQDFPYEYEIYPFSLTLEPLSRTSVAKYAYCEAPPDYLQGKGPGAEKSRSFTEQLTDVIGNDPKINHVGSVYALIIELFDEVLRMNKDSGIDRDFWIEELRRIMIEGEHDHFNFFKSVFMGTNPVFSASNRWWQQDPSSDLFPGYPCATNPSAYKGQPNSIRDSNLRQLAWLGNLYYWSILILLDYYYRHKDEKIRGIALMSMMVPLKSIGQRLARHGEGLPFDTLSLGTSPCNNGQNNLDFCCRLMSEVSIVSASVKDYLPSEYPSGIELTIQSQLKSIIADQRRTNSVENSDTLMSVAARKLPIHAK